jgi:hypothetical protein
VTGFFTPDDWILGTAELGAGDERPVYWKALSGGRWSTPRVLPAPSHHGRGQIVDITAEGHFVATDERGDGRDFGSHGYLFRHGEIVPIVGGTTIGTNSWPVAMSSADVVVGRVHEEGMDGVYVWELSVGSRRLPDLPTGGKWVPASISTGINDRGQVVGYSLAPGGWAAVAWCGDEVVDLQGGGTGDKATSFVLDKAIAVTATGFVLGQVQRDDVIRAATWRLSTACAPVLP